jgi:hypothetical protein
VDIKLAASYLREAINSVAEEFVERWVWMHDQGKFFVQEERGMGDYERLVH